MQKENHEKRKWLWNPSSFSFPLRQPVSDSGQKPLLAPWGWGRSNVAYIECRVNLEVNTSTQAKYGLRF